MDVILPDGQEVRPPELAVQVDATAALEAGYADVSIAPTCSDLYELHLSHKYVDVIFWIYTSYICHIHVLILSLTSGIFASIHKLCNEFCKLLMNQHSGASG